MNDIMPGNGIESTAHQIPGWSDPRGRCTASRPGAELICQREASVDVLYTDGGVEDTFAPELIRTDQVAIDDAGATVHVGETVIHSRMTRTSRRTRPGSSPRRWWSWPTTPTDCDDRRRGAARRRACSSEQMRARSRRCCSRRPARSRWLTDGSHVPGSLDHRRGHRHSRADRSGVAVPAVRAPHQGHAQQGYEHFRPDAEANLDARRPRAQAVPLRSLHH